jgi:hypothetical protein
MNHFYLIPCLKLAGHFLSEETIHLTWRHPPMRGDVFFTVRLKGPTCPNLRLDRSHQSQAICTPVIEKLL